MEFDFTPEQIQLRKSVREFAEQEIRPHVLEWDEEEIFPLDVVKKAGELGFLGAIFPEELGGVGARLHRVLDHHRRALAHRSLGRPDRRGAQFAVHQSHFCRRQRGAAPQVHPQARHWRVDRLVVAHRIGIRFRRRGHAHQGG